MQTPQFLVLENPGKYEKDNEETARKYEKVERETLPLLEKIVNNFENTNKAKIGYTDHNRPPQPVIDEYTYGSVKIQIETVPQQKRIASKKVLEQTEFWLKFIEGDYYQGIKRKGVITIDNNPYVSLDWTIAMIKKSMEENKEGKEGVRQSITFEKPEHINIENIEKVVYDIKKDYSAETEENAFDYVRARLLLDKITKEYKVNGEKITGFYKAFREKALKKKLGYDKDNMPSQTVQEYVRIGNHMFPIQVIPSISVSYTDILNNLVKENPSDKITKTTGELIKLREERGEDLEGIYDLKKEKNGFYIGLEALKTRVNQLKQKHTKEKLTYNISHAIRLD